MTKGEDVELRDTTLRANVGERRSETKCSACCAGVSGPLRWFCAAGMAVLIVKVGGGLQPMEIWGRTNNQHISTLAQSPENVLTCLNNPGRRVQKSLLFFASVR